MKRLENDVKKTKEAAASLQEKRTTDAARKEELEECLAPLEGKVQEYTEAFAAAQNEVASATKEYQAKKQKLEADKALVMREQQEARHELDSQSLQLDAVRADVIRVEKEVERLRDSLTGAQQHQELCGEQRDNDVARLVGTFLENQIEKFPEFI